jgi:hypothetical protein
MKRKKDHKPRKNEGISRSRLEGMGMMGSWIEVGAQLCIIVKLISISPLGAC